MNRFTRIAGLIVMPLVLAACGPKTPDDGTQVHVSTTSGGDSMARETTVVVTPPPSVDTVVQSRTDTVVKVVPGRVDTVHTTTPPTTSVSASERTRIDAWLRVHADSLNRFGDVKATAYTGGTPLFNETTGQTMSKYDYIAQQHPDRPWMQAMSAPSTPAVPVPPASVQSHPRR